MLCYRSSACQGGASSGNTTAFICQTCHIPCTNMDGILEGVGIIETLTELGAVPRQTNLSVSTAEVAYRSQTEVATHLTTYWNSAIPLTVLCSGSWITPPNCSNLSLTA